MQLSGPGKLDTQGDLLEETVSVHNVSDHHYVSTSRLDTAKMAARGRSYENCLGTPRQSASQRLERTRARLLFFAVSLGWKSGSACLRLHARGRTIFTCLMENRGGILGTL